MAEPEKNPQSDFMMEKIKERPVNKKKLLRRTVTTVAMAVIFGMIACVTFLTLEPVISNLLYPEEKPDAVIFRRNRKKSALRICWSRMPPRPPFRKRWNRLF